MGALGPVANGQFVLRLPPEYRARAFGVVQAGVHLMQGVAVLATGLLAQNFAVPSVVGVWGLAGVALMLIVVVRWPAGTILASDPLSTADRPDTGSATPAGTSTPDPSTATSLTAGRASTARTGPRRRGTGPRRLGHRRRDAERGPGADAGRPAAPGADPGGAGLARSDHRWGTPSGRRRATWHDGAVTGPTFYEAVGGEETFRRLVDEFYRGVADDPVLRPLYPEEDLGPASDRLRMFLEPVLGRPDHLLRPARPPAPADAARAVPGRSDRAGRLARAHAPGRDGAEARAGVRGGRCGTTSSGPPGRWSTPSSRARILGLCFPIREATSQD